MPENDLPGDSCDDDYYAFLNVSKTASTDEVRNAYKLLSKRFHPDKHSDPQLKLAAEAMFNRLKKVYDVLSDPQKRAVYDTVGASGVEGECWALVERKFRSAAEIKEEYEQMKKEKEERRMQQRTNPKGNVTVLIDATDIFEHYDEDDEEEEGGFFWPAIEVRSMSISQTIEAPITTEDCIILGGNLNVRNGVGSGTVSTTLRHVFSPSSWFEAEFGAGQGPVISGKYFRTLTSDIHATAQTFVHVTPFGIRPGLVTVLTRQFSKNFVGYISWKAGGDSSLSTVVVYENQLCRVNSSISFGIRNSYISSSYTHKFQMHDGRVKLGVKLGTQGAMFEYGCEARVSQHSILGAAISIGSFTGVTLRIKLVRNQQNYLFPIILSEEILPTSVFYGTALPLLGFYLIKSFFVDPYIAKKEAADLEEEKAQHAGRLDEQRKQATTYRRLMAETYKRTVDREVSSNGLVIERAIYGERVAVQQYATDGRPVSDEADAFDVTVAVAVMTSENSTLTFSDVAKCHLPGFFDCNYGQEKVLFVRYRYREDSYEVLLEEREPAVLPSDRHKLR